MSFRSKLPHRESQDNRIISQKNLITTKYNQYSNYLLELEFYKRFSKI